VTGHGQPQIVAQLSSPGSGTSLPGLAEVGTSPRRPTRAWSLLGLGLGALLVAVLSWSLYPRGPSAPAIRSLAVLPLENLSGDSQDYFADGMTDELITHLGQISALRVISRTSVMTYMTWCLRPSSRFGFQSSSASSRGDWSC